MKNRLIILTLCFLWALLLAGPQIRAQNRQVNIGEIIQSSKGQVRPIYLSSSDPRIESLMKRAFDAHGAYELVKEKSSASLSLYFASTENNTVQLSLENPTTGEILNRQTFTGQSLYQAALRAGDAVVMAQEKIPGFFGGKLAFVSDRTGCTELYVSDMFFEEVRQLTKDKAHCSLPQFSPDGQRLLYTTYFRNGFMDLFAIDMVNFTREKKPIANYQGVNTGGVFSPDGSRIALILSFDGNTELCTATPRGQSINRLTRTKALESEPSWSPDGTRLVYNSDAAGRPQLYEIPASGGAARRIPTNLSNHCAEPDWNPRDANQIVFTYATGGSFKIALWDFSTKTAKPLQSGPGDAVEPEWTNDGRHVIYTERTGKYRRLMIVDTQSDKMPRPLHGPGLGNSSQASFVYP